MKIKTLTKMLGMTILPLAFAGCGEIEEPKKENYQNWSEVDGSLLGAITDYYFIDKDKDGIVDAISSKREPGYVLFVAEDYENKFDKNEPIYPDYKKMTSGMRDAASQIANGIMMFNYESQKKAYEEQQKEKSK